MENMLSKKGEMDGEVFISGQSWHLSFVNTMIKVLLSVCTLNWRVKNYRRYKYHENGLNRENKSNISII